MNTKYDFDLARYNPHLWVTDEEMLVATSKKEVLIQDDIDPIVEK